LVEFLEEGNGFQVFAPAMNVGHPFAVLAAVVAIQHGRDRIDAQAVEVKMLEPLARRGGQNAAHLLAAEVVDQRVPVLVEAFARIGMFVQVRAVELREAVRVRWEVRGYPVEDDAESRVVAAVDEVGESGRRTETSAWCELRQRLITP